MDDYGFDYKHLNIPDTTGSGSGSTGKVQYRKEGDFIVESGTPPPGLVTRRIRWPFAKLAVGEAVTVDPDLATKARYAVTGTEQRTAMRFEISRLDNGGLKIWRIA